MNGSENNELLEKALHGGLNPREEARLQELLAQDAGFRAAFEEEKALNTLLEALPPAPVSSNFTARVLAAARLEAAAETREAAGGRRRWFGWKWQRALATGAVALAAGGFLWEQERREAREEMAESLTHFSEVAATFAEVAAEEESALRPVAMLQDFQAIQHLSQMPGEQEQDLELYLALHK